MFVSASDYIKLRKTFRIGNILTPKQFAELCDLTEAKIRPLFRTTSLRNRIKESRLSVIEPFSGISDPSVGGGGIFIILDEKARRQMRHYAELAGNDSETYVRRAQRAGFEFLIKEENGDKEVDCNTRSEQSIAE